MSNDTALQPHHNIYKQALKKCPDLKSKLSFLPGELMRSENPSFSKLKRIHRKMSITCLTTQDPDICFFYSMYNISVNKLLFRSRLESFHKNLPENLEIPRAMKDTFKMPVSLNEIVRIKGTVTTETGEQKEIDILLENDYEIYQTMSQYQYKPTDLKAKKVPVYDFDSETEWAMLYLAYNGGMSVVDTYLKEFLIKKKAQIASRKVCALKEKSASACQARQKLLQDQSLTLDLSVSEPARKVFDRLHKIRVLKWEIKKIKKTGASSEASQSIAEKEKQITHLSDSIKTDVHLLRERTLGKGMPPRLFSDYLLLEYNGKIGRRAEVMQFLGKIKADATDLHNIKTGLKKTHELSPRKPSKTETDSFIKFVTHKCQFPLWQL